MPFILTSKSNNPFSACHALKGAFFMAVCIILLAEVASTMAAEKVETHPINKECEGAIVLSTSTSTDFYGGTGASEYSEAIAYTDRKASDPAERASERIIEVLALGPVFGSVDSLDVSTDVACTSSGVVLTAITTRNDESYSVQKDSPWRPTIKLMLTLRQPEIEFVTVWKLRLRTEVELDHARVPWRQSRKFPVIVTQKIR